MYDVIMCLTTEHNPWLVGLATLICCVGGVAATQNFERVRRTLGIQRAGWVFLTAIATGATVWCTHFVAMIAYEPSVPVHLSPVLTLVSLIVAIVGASVGLAICSWGAGATSALLGGGVVGASVAAMHYTGMAAYRVDGIVQWRWSLVIASVVLGVTLTAAAFSVLCSPTMKRYRLSIGTGLFVAAVASLHFTAMGAVSIAPMRLSDTPISDEGMHALGLATGLVGLLVICTAIAAALIDRHSRSAAIQRLQRMAMTDALTGLPNRLSFKTELQARLATAGPAGAQLAVIAIDLDRFKEINDLYGHKAGDDVLIEMATRMREALPGGTVARFGGDEFVGMINIENHEQAFACVSRLDASLRQPLFLPSFEARLAASIGVAIFPRDANRAEDLTNNADLAMYRAKREKSPVPHFYDALLDDAIRERRELANDLRQAAESEQLDVHYQVQASVASQEVTGYEALLRWQHPRLGDIPPSDFIPLAEEHGLIGRLGEWVLWRACSDAAGWSSSARVAINVSPLQLSQADLPQLIGRVLAETGLAANRLEIELTESAIMSNRERALAVLRQIKAMGVGVALDDFGTGYSSLETLRVFPFDKIKLDRFFISGVADSPESIAIVRAVLALGKSLSIPVLAEGIETREQFETLRREGCDEAQGFLLGRPQPMRDGDARPQMATTQPSDAGQVEADRDCGHAGRIETPVFGANHG